MTFRLPHACPNCDGALEFVEDADVDSAPWVCAPCARGWWPGELKASLRGGWDRLTRSWRAAAREAARAAMDEDRRAARADRAKRREDEQ